MITADCFDRRSAKLAIVDATGSIQHRPRSALAALFSPGDLAVANDAATLPASLRGTHCKSGKHNEIQLVGWISPGDPIWFVALAFGSGDHRTRTEDRPAPPPISIGDHLVLGPLLARVKRLLDHPRLIALRFAGDRAAVLAGIARHGRPIQYAHIPEPLALWDVWTSVAAEPVAFEPPSAGFALNWRTFEAWRERGIGFATLTHAAGISSTGDPELDLRLPFDEPYDIPDATVAAISRTKSRAPICCGAHSVTCSSVRMFPVRRCAFQKCECRTKDRP
jgi:S-adenosylmethionine:tRNA ribosyltransferase-isomerase